MNSTELTKNADTSSTDVNLRSEARRIRRSSKARKLMLTRRRRINPLHQLKGARIGTLGMIGSTHEGIFGGIDQHGTPFVIENVKHNGVTVRRLQDFSPDGKWCVIERAPVGSESQFVDRALRLQGRKYKTWSYNCQHFTSEVYTGKPLSWQLPRYVILGVGILIALWPDRDDD